MRPVLLYESQLRLEQTIGVYAGACNAKCNCRRCKKPTADFADTGPEHLGALRLQADSEAIRAFGRGKKDRAQRLEKLKASSLHAEANGLAGAMLFWRLAGLSHFVAHGYFTRDAAGNYSFTSLGRDAGS